MVLLWDGSAVVQALSADHGRDRENDPDHFPSQDCVPICRLHSQTEPLVPRPRFDRPTVDAICNLLEAGATVAGGQCQDHGGWAEADLDALFMQRLVRP